MKPFSGIDPLDRQGLAGPDPGIEPVGNWGAHYRHNVRETLSVYRPRLHRESWEIMKKGTPEALSNDPEVRRVYLGDNFRLIRFILGIANRD